MTENIKALVRYRMQQADEALEAAKILLDKSFERQTLNRAYYAMFYAVLALLSTRKMETSKHTGAIALFDKEFIRKGIFTSDFSRWLHKAFDLRQEADYKADCQVTKESAIISLENAEIFIKEVKAVLAGMIQ